MIWGSKTIKSYRGSQNSSTYSTSWSDDTGMPVRYLGRLIGTEVHIFRHEWSGIMLFRPETPGRWAVASLDHIRMMACLFFYEKEDLSSFSWDKEVSRNGATRSGIIPRKATHPIPMQDKQVFTKVLLWIENGIA